jgi:hypothetical protein
MTGVLPAVLLYICKQCLLVPVGLSTQLHANIVQGQLQHIFVELLIKFEDSILKIKILFNYFKTFSIFPSQIFFL